MATHAPLTVEHLMARARREAGLQNIGTTAFDPPLRKLVDATNAIMDNIHDKGRVRAEEWIGEGENYAKSLRSRRLRAATDSGTAVKMVTAMFTEGIRPKTAMSVEARLFTAPVTSDKEPTKAT